MSKAKQENELYNIASEVLDRKIESMYQFFAIFHMKDKGRSEVNWQLEECCSNFYLEEKFDEKDNIPMPVWPDPLTSHLKEWGDAYQKYERRYHKLTGGLSKKQKIRIDKFINDAWIQFLVNNTQHPYETESGGNKIGDKMLRVRELMRKDRIEYLRVVESAISYYYRDEHCM